MTRRKLTGRQVVDHLAVHGAVPLSRIDLPAPSLLSRLERLDQHLDTVPDTLPVDLDAFLRGEHP